MNKRAYRAKASSWGLGEGKSAPQVAVVFDVLTEGAAESRLTWFGSFSDAAADRTIESLRHCGWTGDNLEDLQGLDANEVELVVEDEEYEGKIRAKVQWVNKPGTLSLKAPLQGDKLKAFAASMKERIRALDAAGGRKRTPAVPGRQHVGGDMRDVPPPSDADIPF